MTQNDDNSFGRARERVRTALAAMGFGNPEPYIDCWAKSDDATLTHIYRRIDGEWRLVHGHADFPPADQRAPAGGERA